MTMSPTLTEADYPDPEERGKAQARLDRQIAIVDLKDAIAYMGGLPPFEKDECGNLNLANVSAARAALSRLEEADARDS